MGDTWQATCHNAWQRHAMCMKHGMPCVNMHGSFQAYIRGFTWAVCRSKESSILVREGSIKEKEEEVKGE